MPVMISGTKVVLKLRGKLTLTYLAVGLVLTLVNVWSARWLQRRAEQVATDRAETVRMAEDMAALGNSTFEEGFAYVLSGDTSEKQSCLTKLERFDDLRKLLVARTRGSADETGVMSRLEGSSVTMVQSAHRMFDAYERSSRVNRQSFEVYEAASDDLSDQLHRVTTLVRQRADADNHAARKRLDRSLLGVAALAALLGIAMGAIFTRHLTRPLERLRVAAARFGRGDLDFELAAQSGDEFGQVTHSFSEMASNIRLLLTTVADQKRHLEDVFASLGEMLLVCTPDGVITSVNQSLCATLGYNDSELIGKNLDALLDATCFEDLQRRALGRDSGGISVGEGADLQMLRKDGGRLAVSVSSSLLRTNGREYAGIICVAQDLSERRRLEAELRQAQKLQAIGRLASGVAHEINTPVQFVGDSVHFAREATRDLMCLIGEYQAGAQALQGGAPFQAAFREVRKREMELDLPYLLERLPRALERATHGLERIAAIVRSMKIFAHPGQVQMVAVDLNEAVLSTLTIAQGEYKYVADLETSMGQLPLVTCHVGEINQAVLNLVVNAAHAIVDNPQPNAKGRITVKTRQDGESVVISISDTGAGIPEGIRERIFDPFFTTKEVGKGTGQGLSVARAAIVEKHRGQLSFETKCGEGTTFHIRLPIGGVPASLGSSPTPAVTKAA